MLARPCASPLSKPVQQLKDSPQRRQGSKIFLELFSPQRDRGAGYSEGKLDKRPSIARTAIVERPGMAHSVSRIEIFRMNGR